MWNPKKSASWPYQMEIRKTGRAVGAPQGEIRGKYEKCTHRRRAPPKTIGENGGEMVRAEGARRKNRRKIEKNTGNWAGRHPMTP